MKFESKLRVVDFKTFTIPLIVIITILFFADNLIIDGVKNHYYNHIKEDTIDLALNYSSSLTTAKDATEIINTLLDEKLLAASNIVALYDEGYSNELLKQMAVNLEVDVIYYYNSKGEIIYSNDGSYLDWKTYDGHPTYDFMNSNDISLIEDIRKDSDSELYYKYSYSKEPNGGFIQIGVLAEKIYTFLDKFDIQYLIEELSKNENNQVYFINKEYKTIASTDKSLLGYEIQNPDIINAILSNEEYSFVGSLNGERVYQVYVPVFYNGEAIGTLHVAQSMKATEEMINQVNNIAIIGLLIIFASVLYVLISLHKKNKQFLMLAYYDSLTNLPNSEYLKEYLTDISKKNNANKSAIILMNFIDFKTVNLVLGYEYGDKALQEISKRLNKVVDSNNKLFRFTADRFILHVTNYDDIKELKILLNTIREEFMDPILESKHLEIQFGILELNNKYYSTDEILKNVSISLDHLNTTNNIFAFFNEDMDKKLEREDLIEKELRIALFEENTDKIYLVYQPLLDLKTNQIVSFEALARMKTESLGPVSPNEFINIAERKQLIVPLGNFVLKNACAFIANLNRQGFKDIKIAVNISSIQLLKDDFNETVMGLIEEAHINGSNLELEITESVLMKNFDLINRKLKKFRDAGISIYLDDFGTGYSSFARLKSLNIDYIKIDRQFIDIISTTNSNKLITGDIISMSHKLGLLVVAEGVEDEIQKKYLFDHKCNIMQGFLFSKPLAEDDALQILTQTI